MHQKSTPIECPHSILSWYIFYQPTVSKNKKCGQGEATLEIQLSFKSKQIFVTNKNESYVYLYIYLGDNGADKTKPNKRPKSLISENIGVVSGDINNGFLHHLKAC